MFVSPRFVNDCINARINPPLIKLLFAARIIMLVLENPVKLQPRKKALKTVIDA